MKTAVRHAEKSSPMRPRGTGDVRPSKRIKLEPQSEAVLLGGSDGHAQKVREFIIDEVAAALQGRMESLGKLLSELNTLRGG